MKVLIVEDKPDECRLLEEQIGLLGHEVSSCYDAEEALKACQQMAYSLFVVDLGLPDMDGIELCRRIRTLPQGSLSMILVVTGRDKPDDLQRALESGANDYLSKPVRIDQLKVRLTIIERQLHDLIRRKQTEKALNESLIQIERAKQEWEFTADSLSQIVCLLDSRGRIIRTNRAIEHWKLGQVKEIKERGIHEIFHPNCKDSECSLRTFLHRAWKEVAQGRPAECEIVERNPQRFLNVQVRPISKRKRKNSKDTDSFATLVVNDITAHKQVQETLSKQDRLLLGVAGAMNYLLTTPDFSSAIIQALKTLGLATNIDRVYIFETHMHPETQEPLMSQRFEWDRFSSKAHMNNPEFQNIPYSLGFTRWYEILSANEAIRGLVREMPLSEREMLDPQNIISIIVVPISIGERFWGFIGFDDCHTEREWREEEEAVLFAMAGSIGGAIAREQTERQLRQASSDLRAVFQSLPDEYFRLGADGSILDYRIDQGTDLYLYSESFIGKWASGLLPEEVERQFDTAIEQVHKTQELVSIEYKLPTSDGEERYEEVRLIPFLTDQLIVVARDITDRKQAEEELRKHRDHLEELVQARTAALMEMNKQLQQEITRRKQIEEALRELNQKLEEASKHKSEFLASMSHELRTPLNAMIGYTSLTLNALKESLPSKHLENLGKAEQSARVLLHLINDVLDFSKIEAGEMETFIEEIDLTDILEDVGVIAEGLLLNKSVQLKSDIASKLPAVMSDYTKIKQILNNLVGNAIKFTKEGHVAVRAMLVESRRAVRIEIEDTGEGIPEEKIEHIFESFKQIDGSIKKRFGGTGLGLAITKEFCEMLGIEIGVQSQVGKGSTFWLKIPVQAHVDELKKEGKETGRISKTEKFALPDYRSILLIDDDDMNLNLMEEIFTASGYMVYKAHSGREGLKLASENVPDVILMDLVMPEMDGFDTTQHLKQNPKTENIPVVACSAVATKEFQERAKQTGCVGYIIKPIEPDRLVEQVRKHVIASKKPPHNEQ
jgi:PAS domain S-box-containing protein